MLLMTGLPGGYGSAGSKAAYQTLLASNPTTQVAVKALLLTAAGIFDQACVPYGTPPIKPLIQSQIAAGKWDY
jgi:hypothetical protein